MQPFFLKRLVNKKYISSPLDLFMKLINDESGSSLVCGKVNLYSAGGGIE